MTYVASRTRGQTYVAGFAPNAIARPKDDFYPTPSTITEALLSVEKFHGEIWEPACGDGAMSRILEAGGYAVRSTDLVDRGYGCQHGIDFLLEKAPADNIVTNPPFKHAEEFIKQSVQLARHKVAILGRLGLLEGQRRRKIWDAMPFSRVWIFSRRIAFLNRTHIGDPRVGWL